MPPDINDQLQGLVEQQEHILRQVEDLDRVYRSPSKAKAIGNGVPEVQDAADGAWLTALFKARSRDYAEQAEGKAALEEMGSLFMEPAPYAKATLGTTDATGGYLVQPNRVDSIQKQITFTNPYRRILTVRTGITLAGVNLPVRSYANATRATIVAPGATKPNLDLTTASYTATMYTLARIYDVGNQLLRHSAGAAEADVRSELANAIGLGERYYTVSGTGTNEPYGLVTALAANSQFTTSFASASTTTVAGSLAAAVAATLGPLASRNRVEGLTAVVGPTTYATAIAEGSDSAGFWFNPAGGANALPGWPPGTLTIFGIPVIVDPELTGKSLIVGQFAATTMYIGQSFRIDVSDQAGTRWDTNETGFRGEEEFGINFLPSVIAGAYQTIAAAVP